MDVKIIRKYEGKKVLIILKNNFQYTCVIPNFKNSSFKIIDKFGKEVEIECDFIGYISEVEK